MEWRKEEKWMNWEDREIEGKTVTFNHLRSFDMAFQKDPVGNLPSLSATIRVVFDCHVVTGKHRCEEDGEDHHLGPQYWQDTGGNCRIFDQARYDKSHTLPTIISTLPQGTISCYVGKQNNYMVWKPADAGDAHYQAFFDIYKSAKHQSLLVLYVQSAYLKDQPLAIQRDRKKAFGRICAELLGAVEKKKKGPAPRKRR